MPDNPNVVALLKEYKNESSIKRPEVAKILDKTIGYVAGICNRHGVKPWPKPLAHVLQNRLCQFPIGCPGTEKFHLCDQPKAPGHGFLCEEHKDTFWKPNCTITPIKR